MKRAIIITAAAIIVSLTAIGIQVAYATGVCASTSWSSWIQSKAGSLQQSSALNSGSAAHTARMIASQNLYHDPGLSIPSGGTKVGEIVGYGPDAASIQSAFMNSSSHRVTATDSRWTHYGYSAKIDSTGKMWVTIRYATIQSAPKQTTAKPKPVSTPKATKASPSPTKKKSPAVATKKSARPRVAPVQTSTPTPSPTITEERNEETTYRDFPRVDEQPAYAGPLHPGTC